MAPRSWGGTGPRQRTIHGDFILRVDNILKCHSLPVVWLQIVAKLVHKEAVAASEGKTEIRDVEVLTPTSSQNEIDSAVSDESNHFVFVLENRTNLLTSILAGMKVEYGYTLLAQPEER